MWHCLYLLFTLRVGIQEFEEYSESSLLFGKYKSRFQQQPAAQQQSQVAATSDV